jgi:hypothetical protein
MKIGGFSFHNIRPGLFYRDLIEIDFKGNIFKKLQRPEWQQWPKI